MKLRDIMSKNIEAVSADSTLSAAASTMARLDIGFLPVLDGEQVVGAITDRDVVVRAIAEGRDPTATKVSAIMTKGVETLSPDDDIADAAKLIKEKQIRRVVLKDDAGVYLGVVSLGDLAQRTPNPELSGGALEKVCEPAASGS